ncbi:MAG: HipA domain-containing protein [Candidatus Margulisbacteria bacterium]|nr:HipA domain-containing protein [Candidatus Margulisiibacteriota bacterium]
MVSYSHKGIIGNCDAPAKNFSILHNELSFSLAPFYDLVSTDVYKDIDKKMAIKIGNTWDIRAIQKNNFYYMAEKNEIKAKICEAILTGIQQRHAKIT